MKKEITFITFICAFITFLPQAYCKDSAGGMTEITPPYVYSRVQEILQELELIRFEMGKPKVEELGIVVTGAAPREVYFQALTLFRKANRLSFEQTLKKTPDLFVPEKKLSPAHVLEVVNMAMERITIVKKAMGISEATANIPVEKTKTPTDVYISIVKANRQLNLLLDLQFSPSDVYQEITKAIAYVSPLLELFHEVPKTIPKAPSFERGKQPKDVYSRLKECIDLIENITALSGIEMLNLKTEKIKPMSITPSDVYDIASLVVSEVTYLYSRLKTSKLPHKAYYPGRKFPSHVYQRAGILQAQLNELNKQVIINPKWLEEAQ